MISNPPKNLPKAPVEEGAASARGFAGASRLRSRCALRPEEEEAEAREDEAGREPEGEREAEELRTAEGVPEARGTTCRLQRSSPSAEKTFL